MFNVTRNSKSIVRLSHVVQQLVLKRSLIITQQKLKYPFSKINVLSASNNHSISLIKLHTTAEQTEEKQEGPDLTLIANGDPQLEHKLKVIMLEMEVLRQEGHCVPEENYLNTEHWKELLKLPSRSGRRKYLEFLFKTSKKKENDKLKKQEKQMHRDSKKVERVLPTTVEEFAHTYDLTHNNIFLRFYDSTINNFYNNRLIQAIQFGQKIIVDCGYDNHMITREQINCAKQVMLLFAENRFHDDPYDLHLCNTNQDSTFMIYLHRHIGTLYEPWFPLHVHSESYLDLFPKEKLVYLTPHCREELTTYNHDDIYIIGGIVDKTNNEPVSLAKAKREGLRMAKLPLDRYLQWGSGSGKSLTLNQMIAIMLDVKLTGDWKAALKHVPRRKLIAQGLSEPVEDASDNLRIDRRNSVKRSWTPNFGDVDVSHLKFKPNANKSNFNKSNNKYRQNKSNIDIKNILND